MSDLPRRASRRFAEFLDRRAPWVLLGLVASLLVSGLLSARLAFDFSPQAIYRGDDNLVADAEEFRRTFGYDDAVVLVVLETEPGKVMSPEALAWQRAVMPHPWLVQAANYYYAAMHFGVMLVLLLWLFLKHRSSYAWVRTTVVATTAACLLIQFIPVAPPRMLPGNGFVDLAVQYGQSVYGGAVAGVVPDQLSAMPSVHVAWCVIVAVAVVAFPGERA